MFEIWINDIKSGDISEVQYKAIKRKNFRDPALYFAQIVNLLSILMHLFDRLLLAIPIMSFWVLVFILAVWPQDFNEIIVAIQQPEAAKQALQSLGNFSGIFLGIAIIFGCHRFENKFDIANSDALRRYCRVPALGTVKLTKTVYNTMPS